MYKKIKYILGFHRGEGAGRTGTPPPPLDFYEIVITQSYYVHETVNYECIFSLQSTMSS